jgi:hypothetical protein
MKATFDSIEFSPLAQVVSVGVDSTISGTVGFGDFSFPPSAFNDALLVSEGSLLLFSNGNTMSIGIYSTGFLEQLGVL